MIIKAYSRLRIENPEYRCLKEASFKHILISINSYRKEPVNLEYVKSCPACIGILPVMFDDIGHNRVKTIVDNQLNEYKIFSDSDAQDILNFINCNIASIKSIIIHCEAGISRSQGVAASLSKIFRSKDDIFFEKYCPNMLVYTKMLYEFYNNVDKYRYINAYSKMKFIDLDALK